MSFYKELLQMILPRTELQGHNLSNHSPKDKNPPESPVSLSPKSKGWSYLGLTLFAGKLKKVQDQEQAQDMSRSRDVEMEMVVSGEMME